MFTSKIVAELAAWAKAVKDSDQATASRHLLVTSGHHALLRRSFDGVLKRSMNASFGGDDLECLC